MKEFTKIKFFSITLVCVLLFGACSSNAQIFEKNSDSFKIENSCVSLASELNESVKFQGTIGYKEDDLLHPGGPGLHLIGNSTQDIGTLPINPIQMSVSSNGEEALLNGYEVGGDILNLQMYRIKNREYQKTGTKWGGNSLVWTDTNLLIGTSWDLNKQTISTITTNLTTGEVSTHDFSTVGMSSEPAAKIARNGILTYIWYSNYEGPRLVVYDTKTNKEIARYQNISYIMKPSWHGYLLNPQGTHLLSISSLAGEGYDGKQQELFGVEIGKEPVQITDFHSKYPYTLIYDINFGGQRWSPDNRWIVVNILPSETGRFDSSMDPSWLFLIDLKKNVGYQICQPINPKDQHSITWSPDSRHFALSINDKIWVIDPKTLESRLLVEKPDVPLQVLGWTIP